MKNTYSKWPSKHLRKNLTKKAEKQYLKSVSFKNMEANKQFWDAVKSFLSNKSLHSDHHFLINDENKFLILMLIMKQN